MWVGSPPLLSARQISVDWAACDRLERERGDELLGCGGHDDIHQRPGLRQLAGEVHGLVDGDAARDGEQDAFVVEQGDGFEGHRVQGCRFGSSVVKPSAAAAVSRRWSAAMKVSFTL